MFSFSSCPWVKVGLSDVVHYRKVKSVHFCKLAVRLISWALLDKVMTPHYLRAVEVGLGILQSARPGLTHTVMVQPASCPPVAK